MERRPHLARLAVALGRATARLRDLRIALTPQTFFDGSLHRVPSIAVAASMYFRCLAFRDTRKPNAGALEHGLRDPCETPERPGPDRIAHRLPSGARLGAAASSGLFRLNLPATLQPDHH